MSAVIWCESKEHVGDRQPIPVAIWCEAGLSGSHADGRDRFPVAANGTDCQGRRTGPIPNAGVAACGPGRRVEAASYLDRAGALRSGQGRDGLQLQQLQIGVARDGHQTRQRINEEDQRASAARTGTGETEAGANWRGDGHGKLGSDTMLGIDKLYSIGAKGHNI
jgi:hypothetical protein